MEKPITLNREDYNKLVQAERDLNALLAEFDKLEECGTDCQAYRELHKEYTDRIAAMRKNYSPVQ